MMKQIGRQFLFLVRYGWWLLLFLLALIFLLLQLQYPLIAGKAEVVYGALSLVLSPVLEEPAMYTLLTALVVSAACMIVLLYRVYAPSLRWQLTADNRWSYILADLLLLLLVFFLLYLLIQRIYYQNSIDELYWLLRNAGCSPIEAEEKALVLFEQQLPQQFIMRQVFPCDTGILIRIAVFLLFLSSLCEYVMLLLIKKTTGIMEKVYVGAQACFCTLIYVFTTPCFQILFFGAGLLWNLYRCRKSWETSQIGG